MKIVYTFLSLWTTFVLVLLTVCYPPFFAGMIQSAINGNHLDTALIDVVVFILIWPLLIAISIIAIHGSVCCLRAAWGKKQ